MKTVKTRGERAEGVVLVLILVTVGGLAGAASFTHVHDWTMDNSPAHTGDWFGWANAAISELIPLAALLTIRRRRRTGGPIGYPMTLLVAAVALLLSAQLAVAKPGLSGWLLSAVPSLAFLGLSKLVLSVKPPAPPSPTVPDPSLTGPAVPTVEDETEPTPSPARVEPVRHLSRDSTRPDEPVPATPSNGTGPADGDGDRPEPVPAQATTEDEPDEEVHRQDEEDGQDEDGDGQVPGVDLVQLARQRAAEHRAATGRPITRDELRAVLRVANGTASELLRQVRESDRPALVPVPATAFTPRNGTTFHPSAPSEVSK